MIIQDSTTNEYIASGSTTAQTTLFAGPIVKFEVETLTRERVIERIGVLIEELQDYYYLAFGHPLNLEG